jgi:N-acetylglucosamine kinase-like BadF-type ATPase
MKLCVGVDGGGTKTHIVCIDCETKKKLSEAKVASTNWNSVGFQNAKDSLFEGITKVVEDAKGTKDQGLKKLRKQLDNCSVVGIGLSMSGVDRTEDKARVFEWMLELLPHLKINLQEFQQKDISKITVSNDAVAALASGTSGVLHGVVVISGTGMISVGFKNGISKRAGGWGYTM